jgi:fructan beta-fructosidase
VADGAHLAHGQLALTLAPGSRVSLDLQQGEHQALELARNGEGIRVCHRRRGENGVAEFDAHFSHDLAVGRLAGETVTLEWLVDYGSLELLLDDGRLAITQLSFAEPGQAALALEVLAGECRVRALEYRPWKLLRQGSRLKSQ